LWNTLQQDGSFGNMKKIGEQFVFISILLFCTDNSVVKKAKEQITCVCGSVRECSVASGDFNYAKRQFNYKM
jgi:hypothetical protein